MSEIFLSFCVTSAISLVVICVRLLYKSKCKNFQLCCLQIERDVEIENQSDLLVDLAKRLVSTPAPTQYINQPMDARNSMSSDANLRENEILKYENIYNKNLPKRLNFEMTKKSLSQAISSEDLEAGAAAAVELIATAGAS
jgi:hypothetical protein